MNVLYVHSASLCCLDSAEVTLSSTEGAAYWHWGRVWSYVWSVFQVLFCIFALYSSSRIKNTTNKIDLCLQVRVFLYTLAWPSSLLVSLIAISKPGNVHLWGRAFLKMTNFLLLFDVCYRWIRMLRWLRRNWRWDKLLITIHLLQNILTFPTSTNM